VPSVLCRHYLRGAPVPRQRPRGAARRGVVWRPVAGRHPRQQVGTVVRRLPEDV